MTSNLTSSKLLQSPIAAVVIAAVLSISGAGIVALASFAISNNTTISGIQKQLEERQDMARRAFDRIEGRIAARETEWNQTTLQVQARVNALGDTVTSLQTHLDRLDRLIVQAESFEQRLISLERSRDVYNDYFEKLLSNIANESP